MPPGNMAKYDIAILGGDRRTACMATVFAEKGYRVLCFRTADIPLQPVHKIKTGLHGLAARGLDSAPVIIGGIPFAKSGALYCEVEASGSAVSLSELQRSIRKHQKIFAGVIPEDFRRI